MPVSVELYDFATPSPVDVMPFTGAVGGGRGGGRSSPIGGSRPRGATATRPSSTRAATPASAPRVSTGPRQPTPLTPRTGQPNLQVVQPSRPLQLVKSDNVTPFRRQTPKAQPTTPLPKVDPKPPPKPSARPMPATRPLSGANRDLTPNPIANPVGGPQPPKPKPSGGTAGLPSPPVILHQTGGVPGGNYTLKFFDPSYFSEGVSLDYQLYGPVSNYRIVPQSDGYHVWATARTSALGEVQDIRLTGNNVIPNLTPQNTSFQLFKNFAESDQPVYAPSTSPSPSLNPQPYSPLRAAPVIAPSPLAPSTPAPSFAPQISPVIAPPSLAPSTPGQPLPSTRPRIRPNSNTAYRPNQGIQPSNRSSAYPYPIPASLTATSAASKTTNQCCDTTEDTDDCCKELLELLRKVHNALFAEVSIDLTPEPCEKEEEQPAEQEEGSNPLDGVTDAISGAISGAIEDKADSKFKFKGKRIELIDKAFAGLQDAADSQHKEICESGNGAAFPEWWAGRVGADRPQLVITIREISDDGKLGSSKWSFTIPHYRYGIQNPNYRPNLGRWQKGSYYFRETLRDNSKVILNCRDRAEAERMHEAIGELIDPARRFEPPLVDYGERKGSQLKQATVKAVFASFYASGQLNQKPDYTFKFEDES
ncbi:hypothetical protein ACQ4M4_18070 [Leptolyngbya sp. AN02str]|uniref:hypothetical protein n=1 Tax=Leptolyngbya sp. AN02str TaxID=3423363 RepID=UPI003D321A2E